MAQSETINSPDWNHKLPRLWRSWGHKWPRAWTVWNHKLLMAQTLNNLFLYGRESRDAKTKTREIEQSFVNIENFAYKLELYNFMNYRFFKPGRLPSL